MATDLIKNVIAGNKEKESQKLLDIAPDFDRGLMREVEAGHMVLLAFVKGLFTLLVVGTLGAFVFFNYQLTDNFSFVSTKFGLPNLYKQISASNSEIISAQTNANVYSYLEIKANLDKFTYLGDEYLTNFEIFKSPTATSGEQEKAKEKIIQLHDPMRETFLAVKEKIALPLSLPLVEAPVDGILDPLTPEVKFGNELIAALNRKAQEFAQNEDTTMKRENRNYLHAAKLVNNTELKNLIIATDFDTLTDRQVYDLVKDVNTLFVNDLTIVNSLKSGRIRWSDIMNEIDLRTKTVDNYYNQNFYDNYGGIRYTSYDFDSDGQKISIIGETKRFDTTNFTMISNLIDELNRSDMFDSAAMRSFSKSGSLEDGYSATLKLGMDLNKEKILKE
mgnify:CR=1 FL=1